MVDAAPPSSAAESDPGWFEEVAVGALAPGVSPRTASTLKLACGLLLLPELLLLRVSLARGFGVAYVLVLIALSLGFVAAVLWLLSELGTTSAVEQRKALGLDGAGEKPASAGEATPHGDASKTD